MNDYYYDNSNIEPDENNIVFIDRIYGLEFNQFNESLWNKLMKVYASLPNHIEASMPCWYGIEGKDEIYLWASVEPSGLQVSGVLHYSDWEKWESKFNSALSTFPLFEV